MLPSVLSNPCAAARQVLGIVAASLVIGACGGGTPAEPAKEPAAAKKPMTHEERVQRLERLMARENGPFGSHEVKFLDGLAVGKVESATRPKIECGDQACVMEIDLGKDEDGDPNNIVCLVTQGFEPFGPKLLEIVGEATLTQTPELRVREAGQGTAVRFVADMQTQLETSIVVQTMKIENLYARGYMARCLDQLAGGRKTFERIVGSFFDSLVFQPRPETPAVFTFGYQHREGDRTTGFRAGFIAQRPEGKPGHDEIATGFDLEADGKTWEVGDLVLVVERDVAGTAENMVFVGWKHGRGPVRISAKPSEDKKLRLKLEAGTVVNALEMTPKAALSTEIWAAPELLAVSSGRSASFTYSLPSVDDSGDPTLSMITVKRSAPGVLLEIEAPKGKPGEAPPAAPDELHVDARGIVTKEVSADGVSELVASWGELPPRGKGRRATP